MGADSFFRMGSTHQVCQDYAANEERDGISFAALSDGCSSSPHTDFGARFLVRAGVDAVTVTSNDMLFARHIALSAIRMASAVGVPSVSLDATLLMVAKTEYSFSIYRAGDGVVAWRERSGELWCNVIEFDNNAPRYLNYLNDSRASKKHSELVPFARIKHGRRSPEAGWLWLEKEFELGTLPLIEEWPVASSVDLALIFSDGIQSFCDEHGEPIELATILDELFSFKGYAGEFIKRRCQRFLSDCAARGWKHTDDFSAAGIWVGP